MKPRIHLLLTVQIPDYVYVEAFNNPGQRAVFVFSGMYVNDGPKTGTHDTDGHTLISPPKPAVSASRAPAGFTSPLLSPAGVTDDASRTDAPAGGVQRSIDGDTFELTAAGAGRVSAAPHSGGPAPACSSPVVADGQGGDMMPAIGSLISAIPWIVVGAAFAALMYFALHAKGIL